MTGIIKSFIQNQINKANLKRTATAGQQTSSQGVTQTTPQDTSGNYVVQNSGGGITVVSPVGKVVTTPTPSTTTYRSSGGGGSSNRNGIPTPAATIGQQNTFNALDLPPPINQGTVTKATSNVGVGNAINYFKQNIGRESAVNLIKGTGQVLGGTKTGGLRDRITNKVSTAEQGLTYGLTKGFPSSKAESNYTSTVNDFNSKSERLNKDIQNYEAEVNKYPDGAPPDVYARLTAQQDALNSRIANQTAIGKDLEQVGVKITKSNQISKVGVGVVEGVIGTIAFFPKLVLHPVKTVKETIGGLTQLPQSIYDQPARTIGGLVGSVGTGWLIGKVGGRVINGKPVDTVKLNSALEGAIPEPVKVIETTSEAKIKLLKLSSDVEAQALAEIKAGRTVRIQESKITHPDPVQQKIIDQGLGKTKILSLDVVNNVGNTIARRTFVGVEIKKGIFTYKETTVGKGQGVYNPDLNTAVIDTNYLGFNKKGQPVNVFKERNVIKFNQPVYDVLPETYKTLKSGDVKLLNEAQILRLVKANSYNIEGSVKVRALPKKTITFKNMQDVVSSEFNRISSSKTRTNSIQYLKSLELSNAELSLNGNDLLGAVGVEKVFNTLVSETKTTKIRKPFEYDKVFSKSMKPFKITDEIKGVEQPKSSPTSQVLEQPKPIIKPVNTLDIGQLPELDLTKQIKESVQFGAKEVNKQIKVKPFVLPPSFKSKFKPISQSKFSPISESKLQLTPKQKELLSDNSLSNINLNTLVDTYQKENTKTKSRGGSKSINIQTPSVKQNDIQIQSPQQINSQLQKLNQIQVIKPLQQFNFKPYVPTPVIPKPIVPFGLPFFQQGAGQQNFNRFARRNKKPIPKYTASLVSAAFESKPLKVTKEQIEKLNNVVFTGAEIRPTLELISNKEMKKGLKKVTF